jgi:hypothetical protein
MEGGDGEGKGRLGVVDFGAGGLEEIVHEGGYTVEYPSSWSGLSLDLIILALDLGICRRFSGGDLALVLDGLHARGARFRFRVCKITVCNVLCFWYLRHVFLLPWVVESIILTFVGRRQRGSVLRDSLGAQRDAGDKWAMSRNSRPPYSESHFAPIVRGS